MILTVVLFRTWNRSRNFRAESHWASLQTEPENLGMRKREDHDVNNAFKICWRHVEWLLYCNIWIGADCDALTSFPNHRQNTRWPRKLSLIIYRMGSTLKTVVPFCVNFFPKIGNKRHLVSSKGLAFLKFLKNSLIISI